LNTAGTGRQGGDMAIVCGLQAIFNGRITDGENLSNEIINEIGIRAEQNIIF